MISLFLFVRVFFLSVLSNANGPTQEMEWTELGSGKQLELALGVQRDRISHRQIATDGLNLSFDIYINYSRSPVSERTL